MCISAIKNKRSVIVAFISCLCFKVFHGVNCCCNRCKLAQSKITIFVCNNSQIAIKIVCNQSPVPQNKALFFKTRHNCLCIFCTSKFSHNLVSAGFFFPLSMYFLKKKVRKVFFNSQYYHSLSLRRHARDGSIP